MTKFLTAMAVLAVIASPAFAKVSQSRAEALEKCSQMADAAYGPSGDTSWRRFNHAAYAACMTDAGQVP